jgi:hypothetical protein
MNEMHELGGNFQGYCHDMPLCEQHHHNNRYHLGVCGGAEVSCFLLPNNV